MPLGKPPKYYDYDAYVQKFQKKAATTDDTFTPEELYRDLLTYVDQRIFPLVLFFLFLIPTVNTVGFFYTIVAKNEGGIKNAVY